MTFTGSIIEEYKKCSFYAYEILNKGVILWISQCKEECIVGLVDNDSKFYSDMAHSLRRECTTLTLKSQYNYSEKFNYFVLENQIIKHRVVNVLKIKTTSLILKPYILNTLNDYYS